jgi:hypothetical protein
MLTYLFRLVQTYCSPSTRYQLPRLIYDYDFRFVIHLLNYNTHTDLNRRT